MSKHLVEWLVSLKLYLRICLFLSAPSDLPYSPVSLALTLLAYFIVGLMLLGAQHGPLQVLAHIAVEISILWGLSYLVLKLQKRLSRLLQTLSALAGSGLVVSLVMMAVMVALGDLDATTEPTPWELRINLALLFWNLAVISLIFKRAFEVSTLAAGFIAFNYFLLYELVVFNFLQ